MKNKLETKSVKGMFIGYSHTQKDYKCYIPDSRRVMVSKDVKFVESKGRGTMRKRVGKAFKTSHKDLQIGKTT